MKKLILAGISIFLTTTVLATNWDTSISKDEMTGKGSAYASSPIISPSKRMEFPYSNVKGWMAVGCNKNTKWVYIGFTTAPNLNDTQTEDGYSTITTRIKIDDKVEYITLTQDWGSKFLHFQNDEEIINKIKKANSILLELNWHGSGSVYFKFPLNGSANALKKITNECRKFK